MDRLWCDFSFHYNSRAKLDAGSFDILASTQEGTTQGAKTSLVIRISAEIRCVIIATRGPEVSLTELPKTRIPLYDSEVTRYYL